MSDGTPLRKYGKYRVRQIKHRTPFYELHDETCDDPSAAVIARSYCKSSVDYVGERLGSGRMVATPSEYVHAVVTQYARWHISRFSHVRQAWLLGLLGVHWINGGPVSYFDTDTYSLAGRSWQRAKVLAERDRVRVDYGADADAVEIHESAWMKSDRRDSDVLSRFMVGEWPDVLIEDSRTLPSFGTPVFPSMLTAYVAPEWTEEGCKAMHLLLKYGVDGECPMRETLEGWASQLQERFGGSWRP